MTQENEEHGTASWLARKIDEAKRMIEGPLDRETEIELLLLARKIARIARSSGIPIQTENVRLGRLIGSFNE